MIADDFIRVRFVCHVVALRQAVFAEQRRRLAACGWLR